MNRKLCKTDEFNTSIRSAYCIRRFEFYFTTYCKIYTAGFLIRISFILHSVLHIMEVSLPFMKYYSNNYRIPYFIYAVLFASKFRDTILFSVQFLFPRLFPRTYTFPFFSVQKLDIHSSPVLFFIRLE